MAPKSITTMTTQAIARPVGKPWTLKEAAAFLSVSPMTLYRMAKAGQIRLLRLGTKGTRALIPDAEMRRLIEGA